MSRLTAIVRLSILVVGLVAIAIVSVQSGPELAAVRSWVQDSGWVAPAAFIAVYAALTVALMPGSVLTIAGGLLFGIPTGSVLTIVGATLGATIAFGVARGLGREAVDRLVSGRVARVDAWLASRGFVAVVTLRLVPVVPFNAANYAVGVTGVRPRDYIAGTALGIIPGVVAYTFIGARASDPSDPLFLGALVGLGLLVLAGTLALNHKRRRDAAQRDRAAATSPEPPSEAAPGHDAVPEPPSA